MNIRIIYVLRSILSTYSSKIKADFNHICYFRSFFPSYKLQKLLSGEKESVFILVLKYREIVLARLFEKTFI